MRKVIFATPCYDGKVSMQFLQSLIHTIPLAARHDIAIHPVQIGYDALVQRARNDFVRIALETKCDDLIFMDADQSWEPEWIIRLLAHDVDVVGCPVPKKSDVNPDFNVKILPEGLVNPLYGLYRVESVGTGFLRISRNALELVWQASEEYSNSGVTTRMVFDVQIIDGQLVSEDNVFCRKWREIGGTVWLDPSMTCAHIGHKIYENNFLTFIERLK
jgi:hypothetical protein